MNLFKRIRRKLQYKAYVPKFNYIEIISRLEEEKSLNDVPIVFWALLLNNERIKQKAVRVLNFSIKNLSTKKILSLDKIFRDRTSYNWSYNWKKESIKSLLHDDISEEEKINIIGLATFHSSGYFREKALIELLKIDNPKILPFIIIRINDWVNPIQTKAINFIVDYINKANFTNIVENIYLLQHTEKYTRNNSGILLDKLNDLIESGNVNEEILTCVRSNNKYAREFSQNILIDKSMCDINQLVHIVLEEPDTNLRTKAIERIIPKLKDEELINIREKLLYDKSHKIRVRAITALYEIGYYTSYEDFEYALFDKAFSVREIARFYMKKLGFNQFIDLYKNRLSEEGYTDNTILGLAEVASKNEMEILKRYISIAKTNVVKKILKSLSELDFYTCEKEILTSLEDQRIGVSNQAKRLLVENRGMIDYEKVYQIYCNTNLEHVKSNTAFVLCNVGKWDALAYIIEMYSNKDKDISNIGNFALDKWKGNYNKSFTKPSNNQYEKIYEALIKYHKFMEEDIVEWIRFILNIKMSPKTKNLY